MIESQIISVVRLVLCNLNPFQITIHPRFYLFVFTVFLSKIFVVLPIVGIHEDSPGSLQLVDRPLHKDFVPVFVILPDIVKPFAFFFFVILRAELEDSSFEVESFFESEFQLLAIGEKQKHALRGSHFQ